MIVFNSLGSNYSGRMVWQSLFSRSKGAGDKLAEYLQNRYKSEVVLTYKGREALQLALKAIGLDPDAQVAINGFTCYAVYRAITFAGLKPYYLDIERDSLQFSADVLAKAIEKNPSIKAVIVQNTLGNPCDIVGIEKICQRHNLVLVEDLAHSIGARYIDGREVGTVGDFAMLSFGRDKLIDSVSGGALVINNRKYVDLLPSRLSDPPKSALRHDKWYPLLSMKVRWAYKIGLGKLVHAAFRKLGFMSRSVDAEYYEGHGLSDWQAKLALEQLESLPTELLRRRKLGKIYQENLCRAMLVSNSSESVSRSTNLRFAAYVENRRGVFSALQKKHIYISDTWYDTPIAPARYLSKTTYDHQCQVADEVASQIINLPTHRHITESMAIEIAKAFNQCQQ